MIGSIITIVWLVLGGWAFRRIDVPSKDVPVMLIICILLGPFVAGVAIAELPKQKEQPK